MDTVSSQDGTTIAFSRTGSGPALVLVVGAFCDRQTTRSLTKVLASDFTAYEYDRRGRGASGDTAPYAVEREVEDLAAVAGAARTAGSAPFVFGHSSGAVLALEAAARGVPIARLVAYEPPYIVDESRSRPGTDLAERLAALVSAGRPGDAAKLFLTEAVQVPPEVVATMEGGPDWPAMTALAHTLCYDVVACANNEMPSDRLAEIRVPTLVLGGSESPEWFHNTVRAVAATVPGAEHRFLDGQDHGAADDVLAPVLLEFLRAQ